MFILLDASVLLCHKVAFNIYFSYRLSDRDSAIAFSDRIKSGVVGEQLWLQITEPTEKDMGKYAIEFYDGKGGLRRTVDLSGQGECLSDFITGLISHLKLFSSCQLPTCLHDVKSLIFFCRNYHLSYQLDFFNVMFCNYCMLCDTKMCLGL